MQWLPNCVQSTRTTAPALHTTSVVPSHASLSLVPQLGDCGGRQPADDELPLTVCWQVPPATSAAQSIADSSPVLALQSTKRFPLQCACVVCGSQLLPSLQEAAPLAAVAQCIPSTVELLEAPAGNARNNDIAIAAA